MAVWKSVLEATEKVALTRIVASENYKNNIYEAAKNCRTQKETQLKKVNLRCKQKLWYITIYKITFLFLYERCNKLICSYKYLILFWYSAKIC